MGTNRSRYAEAAREAERKARDRGLPASERAAHRRAARRAWGQWRAASPTPAHPAPALDLADLDLASLVLLHHRALAAYRAAEQRARCPALPPESRARAGLTLSQQRPTLQRYRAALLARGFTHVPGPGQPMPPGEGRVA